MTDSDNIIFIYSIDESLQKVVKSEIHEDLQIRDFAMETPIDIYGRDAERIFIDILAHEIAESILAILDDTKHKKPSNEMLYKLTRAIGDVKYQYPWMHNHPPPSYLDCVCIERLDSTSFMVKAQAYEN